MPRVPAKRCECGCGQPPYSSCRNRLVVCDCCDFKFRASRESLAKMSDRPPCLACGDVMRIPCILDMYAIGERVAESSPEYAAACTRHDNAFRRREGKGKGRHVPKTWTCGGHCGNIIKACNERCKKCGFENDWRGRVNHGMCF